jgi:predicted RNase H-like HicB family nuclease
MMKKKYIAVIDKDQNSDYGVMFPDFLGCVTAGTTIDEATEMAAEALQFHIDGMIEDGEDIPLPSSLEKIKQKYPKAEIFLIIEAKVHQKMVRINITVEESLLRKFDKYLEQIGETRSGFISHEIENKMIC